MDLDLWAGSLGPSRSYIRDLQFVFSFWGVWDPPEAIYEIYNSYLVSGGVWDPPEAIYEICNSYLVSEGVFGQPTSQPVSQPSKKYCFSFKVYYKSLQFLLWAADLDLWEGSLGPSRSYIRDLQFIFSFWGVWDPPEAIYEICNSYLVSGGVWAQIQKSVVLSCIFSSAQNVANPI